MNKLGRKSPKDCTSETAGRTVGVAAWLIKITLEAKDVCLAGEETIPPVPKQ